MRKNVFGRQLKRDKNERKALFKSLLSELVLHGRIQTTQPKAKAIKADAEKLVTKARKEAMLAKKLLSKLLIPAAIDKMMADVSPRFSGRSGGYTRIVKLGKRFNDDAQMVILEWVEGSKTLITSKETKATIKKKKESVENETTIKKAPAKKAETKKPMKKVAPKAKKTK